MSEPVLALGAWLKNRACWVDGDAVHWSAVHGDLRDVTACVALETSARELVRQHGMPRAIAHDLHPDFHSTRLAHELAAEWGIPAIGVQHHHAHVAGVMAEFDCSGSAIGLALDGVGLGTDGSAWGGELLRVNPLGFERLGHLWPLALPGGDVAAREPWRMLASALHAMGRGDEIIERSRPIVGESGARMIQNLLERGLLSPLTTSAGRWFDAAAAALGLAPRQQAEAEAAIALETAASSFKTDLPVNLARAAESRDGVLDVRPLIAELLAWEGGEQAVPEAAAWFHQALADGVSDWAANAADRTGCSTVVLSGGCFFNELLKRRVQLQLTLRGLRVLWPQSHSCGDAGIALGQAWVAARQLPLLRKNEEDVVCA
ncbi:Kae1-like domain-containing protein [Diaphorobacter caeni]|uniref:Kae1-like domain-containing protein n=1 Tax=Diaphorobacter caeni TaxID=2784387 RepID=UPI00188E7048|nr:carbamoyltransferase HypF [Diaphorobacter caeni]MBF5005656.1 carbamoyltransferase HypF [Diaphorobacter caeni]